MNFLAYLYRRLALYWQVLLTQALGIILAVTLLASGPVLVDAVLDFALRRILSSSEPVDAHLRFVTTMDPDASTFQNLDEELSEVVHLRVGSYLEQVVPSGETQWTHPWLQDGIVKDQRLNFSFYGVEDDILLEHAEFVSGGWPEAVRPSENVVATVIGLSLAKDYGLEVGDRLPLSFKPSADQPDLWIEVSGILKPLDYDDPFWFGAYSLLQTDSDTRYMAQYSMLVPTNSFFELALSLFPASDVQVAWHAFLSPETIKVVDLPLLQGQLQALEVEVEALGLRMESGLGETAESITVRTASVRVPLYLLITTVVLLALYYVLMVATLTLRQASREFAVLLSRGASTWQLMRLKLTEAGLICAVALLSGPGLALLLMRGLILFGPLADTNQEYWVLQIPQSAWLAAMVGAAACLISVLSPLPGVVRRSVVTYAQTLSRAGRPPWWQRYYLDVVLMLAGLILLWRLKIYGGILSQSGSGPEVDWLLLLAPLAMLLGAATIMLRVFPVLLQLSARLVSELPGLPAILAFWQAARDPGHIARLVLLLTLAMALGSLSSGLNVALDRNETDRAYYSAGSDLRIRVASGESRSASQGSISETALAIQSAKGFEASSTVLRTTGSLQLTIENAYPAFDVLAIEPQSLQGVVQFRRDFADVPVPSMLNELKEVEVVELSEVVLPGYPGSIGMWLLMPFEGALYVDQLSRNVSVSLDELNLVVKLSTAQDEVLSVQLSPENPAVPLHRGWQYFEGSLPPLSDSSYPLNLLSFWFRHLTRSGFNISIVPQLAFDGLTVVDSRSGEKTTLGIFEPGGPNWALTASEIQLSMDDLYPQSGDGRLLLDFGLSGLDITNWLGVNLSPGTIEPKQNLEDQNHLVGTERQAEDGYTLVLPGHPEQVGVWVVAPVSGLFEVGQDTFRAVGDLSTVDIEVRLRTQGGEVISHPLQSLGAQPAEGYIQDFWQYFWTDVSSYSEDQYPLVLESFGLRVRESAYLPILTMDKLTVVDADTGDETVVEEFEGLGPPYWQLDPSEGIGYAISDSKGRAGNGLFLIFDDYGDLGELGGLKVYPVSTRPSIPVVEIEPGDAQDHNHEGQVPILPVIVSPAFIDLTQAEVGDHIGVWLSSKPFILEVTGIVEYFPTMQEEKDAGYVIALRDIILNHFNRTDSGTLNVNEFFVSLEEGTAFEDVINQIRISVGNDLEIVNAENLRQTIKADPLALGLRSVTTLGYLLTSVLSLVGFGTYFYMSVRQRRKMYGVLRAIGMSSTQIYGSLLLEQVVLILSGLALGTGLGVLLNQLTLPGLPLSLGGQPPIPPFLAETDWAGVFRIYLTLAIAFLVSLGLATLSLGRARLHQVLRVDEE